MPRYRTTAIAFGSVIVAAWLLLSFPVPGSTPTSPGPAHLADSVTSPCGGTVLPHNYSGTVEWNGANAGSSVPIRFSYDAQIMTNLTDGVVLSTVCSALNGTVTPDGAGTFALSIRSEEHTSEPQSPSNLVCRRLQ